MQPRPYRRVIRIGYRPNLRDSDARAAAARYLDEDVFDDLVKGDGSGSVGLGDDAMDAIIAAAHDAWVEGKGAEEWYVQFGGSGCAAARLEDIESEGPLTCFVCLGFDGCARRADYADGRIRLACTSYRVATHVLYDAKAGQRDRLGEVDRFTAVEQGYFLW